MARSARPASPTVRRKELANTLRRLRAAAGLTLDDAARHIEVSAATLSRIENASRVPRARDVRDLVGLYGVREPDQIAEIVELVAEAKEPGWWEAYSELEGDFATLIGYEIAATRIQQYEAAVVQGLLQTPEYARTYLREATSPGRPRPFTDREIEQRVEVRLKRQQSILAPPGVLYEAILDEAALRRPVGGKEVMRRQFEHIAEVAQLSNVSIRLLPFNIGAHPGQPGGFTILTMPQPGVLDTVYVDSLAGQLFLENPIDVVRHRRVWEVLHKSALNEEQTLAALLSMASDGGSGKLG